MAKPVIRLKFLNGLVFDDFKKEVFDVNGVSDVYDLQESTSPDVVVFGPYGNDLPPKGDYTRVGYYCENVEPDMTICEWAFGVPHDAKVGHPKYKRIQWHGIDPDSLIKDNLNGGEALLASKTKFCNFVYSNPVPYREAFFKQLSKYKKVDAPGKSMNNMPSIDSQYQGGRYDVKRQFLTPYKFTIAFENYVYPGYQTEKLYDAMLCQSLPVYCGDPNVGEIFNTKSFLNVPDFVQINYSPQVQALENVSQMNFMDILPQYHHSMADRARRKTKSIGRSLKMKLQFNKLDFSDLIDRIILLDKDPEKYIAYAQQPWFHNNTPPADASAKERWIQIFEESIALLVQLTHQL
ncbi:glycosyltransferase family 10 domain-containing protein [Mucilaginibacter myungsuensis]|uniref:Fucosyltransferase C-terminal domain-containing protein n=1 Tax=Mucilaginibacter myungsuensis TaxID=649104 RepID=A0A929PVZ4_9SPHI|nr:glycosyltransferase family 10 [Mucilaginibacter myungsuensis]MBE9660830.1 hypothetical protein [Mucilaginibacter myungsuensis]MDN3600877.1 glycosyltransferase family 10 [Mucilaginibacter myungsuensis]